MLSILIPTHNFAPSRLVNDLSQQANALNEDVEIIVLDDGSDEPSAAFAIQALKKNERCRTLRNEENQGRARARNILYKESRGEFLLFLDSDAQIVCPDFLAQYLAAAQKADVVCGRLTNPAPPAPAGCELRYKYETHAERRGYRTAAWRNRHPYERIATFQLLVHRRVMQQVVFDESIKGYGYEDVLFGLQLQKQGFTILHTDTPLLHTGINTNTQFLAHTEEALKTLCTLPAGVQQQVTLSRIANRLSRLYLAGAFRLFFQLTRPLLRRNLLSHRPFLLFFQLYKLGLLVT